MTRPFHVIALALASLVLADPSAGRELILGVEQSLTGDSNLFNEVRDPTADGSYRIGPTVRLREDREVLNYDFRYKPNFQVYMVTDDINGWNQIFDGTLTYQPTQRDQLELDARATLTSAVQLLAEGDIGIGGAEVPGIGDTGHYTVDLTYQRAVAPAYFGRVTAGYEQWTYTNNRSIPNISGYGALSGYWTPTVHIQTGIDISSNFRRFEEVGARPRSRSVVSNASLFGVWQFTPAWKTTLSAGPTYVSQRQDAPDARIERRWNAIDTGGIPYAAPFSSCDLNADYNVYFLSTCGDFATFSDFVPASTIDPFDTVSVDFAPGTETTSTNSDYVTYFATAQIEYSYRRGGASLGYTRRQDASGGVSSTNITDAITLRATYRADKRTALSLYTGWSRRVSVISQRLGLATAAASAVNSDPPGAEPLAETTPDLQLVRVDTEQDILQVNLIATATRRLTQNLVLGGQFSYTWQNTESRTEDLFTGVKQDLGGRRFDRYVGRVFMRYEFDAFRF